MIPAHVHTDARAAMEVFAFIMTGHAGTYACGVATVTQPGTGHFATVRTWTRNGSHWVAAPGTLELGYAGMRDAERDMFLRAGLDNASTIPFAADHTRTHAYPG